MTKDTGCLLCRSVKKMADSLDDMFLRIKEQLVLETKKDSLDQ